MAFNCAKMLAFILNDSNLARMKRSLAHTYTYTNRETECFKSFDIIQHIAYSIEYNTVQYKIQRYINLYVIYINSIYITYIKIIYNIFGIYLNIDQYGRPAYLFIGVWSITCN